MCDRGRVEMTREQTIDSIARALDTLKAAAAAAEWLGATPTEIATAVTEGRATFAGSALAHERREVAAGRWGQRAA